MPSARRSAINPGASCSSASAPCARGRRAERQPLEYRSQRQEADASHLLPQIERFLDPARIFPDPQTEEVSPAMSAGESHHRFVDVDRAASVQLSARSCASRAITCAYAPIRSRWNALYEPALPQMDGRLARE